MYKINTLFHVILISTFFYLFPPQVFSLNEDTSQLDTLLFVSVSEERKGFINEIEEAVKNEKKHIQEILDSQTDRASRNLIIIAGAIIIPVSLFLLLWILKFLFNISFSIIRYLFSVSVSGVGAISKRLKDANQYKEEVVEETDKPKRKPMKLGEILINFVSRSVTSEHINMALNEQKKNSDRPLIGQLLIRLGFATAVEVDAALKIQGKKADKNKT
ncbi:MAG: hypothetical protein A2W77_07485 [Nitrospinae bacterium RIFCSPLOWO2_12_39_16]|nr:MAG: hypothetical protein A2W77_07485 [Nitrospinae bacterium RIFCSPLOWO2_12_39_16]HAP66780.1 hypothetical protein [Nitrospinota bacterium]